MAETLWDGGPILHQAPGVFPMGTDSILLAHFARPSAKDRILDLGTGSGILAITSLLLGAKEAVGVDIDEVAVRTAHENAALNGVDERLTVFCGDLTEKVSGTYDVICANIVADVIIRLSADVTKFMHEKSVLLVSGIIEERCEEVKAALCGVGLTIREIRTDGGWAAIRLSF